MPNLPEAILPGHVDAQTDQELRANVGRAADAVVREPDGRARSWAAEEEPGPRDIVLRGTLDEVNALFYEHEWSDGLPIVPPTIEQIETFLRYTDREPDEDARHVAAGQARGDGLERRRQRRHGRLPPRVHADADRARGSDGRSRTTASSTAATRPASDTLIVLNGPIIKDLGFNYEQGALRDGFMPNTSVGRFWRLSLRNIAGFLPHKTDKGTFGNTLRVVLAENEDVIRRIGWTTDSGDQGERGRQHRHHRPLHRRRGHRLGVRAHARSRCSRTSPMR